MDVQFGHLLACIGMTEKHNEHGLLVGVTSGFVFSLSI